MAVVILKCGCEIDDKYKSTIHRDGDDRSDGDKKNKKYHWPLYNEPKGYCISCDLNRPCMCDQVAKLDATT